MIPKLAAAAVECLDSPDWPGSTGVRTDSTEFLGLSLCVKLFVSQFTISRSQRNVD